MRRIGLLLGLLALVVFMAGCGSVYSNQKLGRQQITGDTLADLIKQNGTPDFAAESDNGMILGWNYVEGMNVLGVFAQVKRTTTCVLIDASGKVVERGDRIDNGEGLTIIGFTTLPIISTSGN